MRRAIFFLEIDGADLTSRFDPHLISLSITDADGAKSDALDVTLDDAGGRILLPRAGAKVRAGIGWDDAGAPVLFEGVTDEPTSTGSRGGGMILSIGAKSADPKSAAKSTVEKHKDGGALGGVWSEWAREAGVDLRVAPDLASIERPYWAISNQSFHAAMTQLAREIGATYKVSGDRASLTPRAGAATASGAALPTVYATRPGNIISWSLSPKFERAAFKTFRQRTYDVKQAKMIFSEVEAQAVDGDAAMTDRFTNSDPDQARRQAESNRDEADRDKGGGTVILDGEPSAQSQADCVVSGVRAGIDGTYRIESARHAIARGGAGFTTTLTLKQPAGAAGTDSRAQG